MRFKFIVNKWANFYFFLHNLAECEWPWPYRPWDNKIWKKELSDFTEEEKKALKQLKKIYKKHFLKTYLGEPFFLEKNPWKALKKEIPEKEAELLKDVFSIWEEKFEKIYKKDVPNLKKWQEKLETELKKSSRISLMDLFSEIISTLYKTSAPKGLIKVYLMISGLPKSCGGERGRGIEGKKSILLELSRRPINEPIEYVIGVICHEIAHNCFPDYLQSLLLKTLKKQQLARHVEELINRSLFPIGIFSIRFLNRALPLTLSRQGDSMGEISPGQTIQIINLSDSYIQQKRAIDIKYVKELLRILKRKSNEIK